MYFAILGKHDQISLEELRYIQATDFLTYNTQIVFFNTEFQERLNKLAGIVKRGILTDEKGLTENLAENNLVGVHDIKFGKYLKQNFAVRRFKVLEILRTDREIQNKGLEIIQFPGKGETKYGIVQGYQNIKQYEVIDFDKPARSMHIGMMPAKLTHIMINIGLTNCPNHQYTKIYDPFCGLGTTLLMANALGYDCVGSDIKINHAEKNIERWKSSSHKTDKKIELFKHDVKDPSSHKSISGSNLIVSEGRLGPIVRDNSTPEQIQKYSKQVTDLYCLFFKNTHNYYKEKGRSLPTIVITIPYYIKQENTIEQSITTLTSQLGWKNKTIKQIYSRPKQKVGRQILILSKDT